MSSALWKGPSGVSAGKDTHLFQIICCLRPKHQAATTHHSFFAPLAASETSLNALPASGFPPANVRAQRSKSAANAKAFAFSLQAPRRKQGGRTLSRFGLSSSTFCRPSILSGGKESGPTDRHFFRKLSRDASANSRLPRLRQSANSEIPNCPNFVCASPATATRCTFVCFDAARACLASTFAFKTLSAKP